MAMKERGVLYLVWGEQVEPLLQRSRRSLAEHHPELPVEIVRISTDDPIKALLEKSRVMALSPFRETLYLDADTVVLGRLDFGFEKAARFGLACCICECPWARRYHQTIKGDVIEYNTGVLFFNDKAKAVFDAWERLAPALDSSILYASGNQIIKSRLNDQCGFALAIEETGAVPFVLPLNWNFRPDWHHSFFGPVKIWHSYADPPPTLAEIARYYERSDAIIQFFERPAPQAP